MMSESGLQDFYRRLHEECRLDGEKLPSPHAMQELVQAWRQLWKWR